MSRQEMNTRVSGHESRHSALATRYRQARQDGTAGSAKPSRCRSRRKKRGQPHRRTKSPTEDEPLAEVKRRHDRQAKTAVTDSFQSADHPRPEPEIIPEPLSCTSTESPPLGGRPGTLPTRPRNRAQDSPVPPLKARSAARPSRHRGTLRPGVTDRRLDRPTHRRRDRPPRGPGAPTPLLRPRHPRSRSGGPAPPSRRGHRARRRPPRSSVS